MGTAHRGSVKAGAVALAALFGLFAPGISPATAQEDGGDRPPWAPGPPVDDKLPEDSGAPDEDYLQRTDCIQAEGDDGSSQRQAGEDVVKEGPWGQRHLRLSDVHNYVRAKSQHGKVGVNEETGEPLRVAVIDTGVTEHDFLQGRLVGGGDYVQSDGEGEDGLEDCDGHGTQVAGIISAKPTDSSIGFTGVAPDSEIVSIRQSSTNFSEKTDDEIKQEREQAKRQREEKEAEAKRKREDEARQKRIDDLEKEVEEARDSDDDDDNGGGDAPGGTGPSQEDGEGDGAGQDGGEGGDGGQGDGEDPEGGSPLQQDSPDTAGNLQTLAQAIVRAVDEHDVDVVNMSVDNCRAPDADDPTRRTADEYAVQAALKYATDNDVVPVVSAGNVSESCPQNGMPQQGGEDDGGADEAPPYDVDSTYEPRLLVIPPWFSIDGTALAVGAISEGGGVAPFSTRGPWVSVAAPGDGIISLDPAENGKDRLVTHTFEGDGEEYPLQGTSFAAPYVAGLAVLVKQMHPDLSATGVMERIQKTAQHPGAADGRDQFVGHGVIDPMAALTTKLPEDMGIDPASHESMSSDMPPPADPDSAPMTVALLGSAGAVVALGVTLFTVHTIRRNRREDEPSAD